VLALSRQIFYRENKMKGGHPPSEAPADPPQQKIESYQIRRKGEKFFAPIRTPYNFFHPVLSFIFIASATIDPTQGGFS
jgi:hypothetical protein